MLCVEWSCDKSVASLKYYILLRNVYYWDDYTRAPVYRHWCTCNITAVTYNNILYNPE